MKIYTKTGDFGETSLYNGDRLPKHSAIFDTLGDIDELNCRLGLVSSFCALDALHDITKQISTIQSTLIHLSSDIATPPSSQKKEHFDPSSIEELEEWIDVMTEKLPKLTEFILPGGGFAASHVHVARAVCRRAERKVSNLEGYNPYILKYINRLSDYLFTAARFVSHIEKTISGKVRFLKTTTRIEPTRESRTDYLDL